MPDAEGVTLAAGDPNGIYVATERDGDGSTSRPAVLRYDVSSAAATLNATREWNLTADLPGLGANAGPEAVTWVPDDLLVAKGFLDETAAAPYNPASYPDHGAGLFFVGVEQDGRIIAYALNQTTGTFTRVASIASGFPQVMELEYEPESKHLWAMCDNSCDGRTRPWTSHSPARTTASFVVTDTFERPAGMANLNNEGFAIAPQAECVGGLKPVFWTDDGNADQHALRAGTLNCTVPPPCLGSTATITGTSGNDTLTGTNGPDVIAGEGGDDTIKGLGGQDKICGGLGNDNLSGFGGKDTLSGQTGNDTFAEGAAANGPDAFNGGGGIDVADYRSRTAAVTVSIDNVADDGGTGEGDNVKIDVETLVGGSAGDSLTTSGSTLANKLFGRNGDDTLNVVDGIGGNDTADGGADTDTCTGDPGDFTPGCP